MDAYREFRSRAALRTVRLSVPHEGTVFDDALAFAEDYEENPTKLVGRTTVKRLWTGPHGGVFARLKTGEGVRLLSANMSWMPLYLYRRLSLMAASPEAEGSIQSCTYSPLLSISYDEPMTDAALRRLRLKLAPVEKIASQFWSIFTTLAHTHQTKHKQ